MVGDPGVGKSRLVAEALAQIDARVVRGRCLSYGEGITYWPVIEVVKQLHARPDDEHAAAAISSLLGETETFAGTDEIAWGFRKLLEAQAPLVVCSTTSSGPRRRFSTSSSRRRCSLRARRSCSSAWRGPSCSTAARAGRRCCVCEPLPEDEAGALVGDAVPDEVRERIVRASGGNPLFLTEMAALGDADGGEVEVPQRCGRCW